MAKPAVRKRPQTAIRRVNKALESSVIDVLRDLVPEVKALPREKALESILDDLGLLARCFMAYREDPESFRHLLVNRDKEHVLTSDQIMVCGRSFDDVVSMVVRTAAKRYFRLHLDGRRRSLHTHSRYLTSDEMTAIQRMMAFFGKKYERDLPTSKGLALYNAVKAHLHFDWQVPLVPDYVDMPPELVERLGEQILDYKVSEEIQALLADPDHPPPPSTLTPKPLFVPPKPKAANESDAAAEVRAASITGSERLGGMAQLVSDGAASDQTDKRARLEDILTGDGRRLKASAFSMLLLDPKVRAVLPDPSAAVRVSATLGLVGGNVAKVIVGGLGLRSDQLAVLLIGAHHTMGEDAFIQLFGVNGRLDAVNRLVERARAEGIDQGTPLEKIAELARRGFAPSTPLSTASAS
jgi:hypothetical protein